MKKLQKKFAQRFARLIQATTSAGQPPFNRPFPKNNLVAGVFISLFLWGCTTPPTKFEKIEAGQWEARTTLRRPGEIARTVTMDIVAEKPSQLRIEVTSSLGIHLASFAVNSGKYALALPRQKKFYQGVSGPTALKPVLPVRLDPQWVIDLLFDHIPTDGRWACEKDGKGFLKACVNTQDKMQITWTERERQRRTVLITSGEVELELAIGGFQPNVQGSSSMFVLSRPAGFQLVNTAE